MGSMGVDFEDFILKGPFTTSKRGRVIVKNRMTEKFIKGPILLPWVLRAATWGKSTLLVGLILWFMWGMRNEKTFRMGIRDIAKLTGFTRLTVLRAIKKLEKNSLIFVLREPGRKLVITINRTSTAWENGRRVCRGTSEGKHVNRL